MAMNEQDYKTAGIQLLPKGLAWRQSANGVLGKLLGGLGITWAKVDAEASQALNEMNPQWATVMLEEWEQMLGLPECNQTDQTLSERQNAAGNKWHLKGSLSPWFYAEWVAEAFGYDIEIVAHHPHHCLRGCNYPLYSDEYDSRADVYVRINSENPYRYFNTQDRVNDPLLIGTKTIVECILQKYKPAHIELYFHYEQGE